MNAPEVIAALAERFPPEKVSWRVGSTNKRSRQREDPKAKATKGKPLAYIDARDVMERLDEVVGPDRWQDTYTETAKGRVLCTLSIRFGNEWIHKSDGAGNTDVEGDKGAISDAFKRAAVKWGVGRYLYDVDSPWVKLDDWERIDHSELPRLMALLQPGALNTGSPPAGVGEKSAYAAKKDGQWDVVVGAFRMSASLDMLMEAAAVHKDTIALWPGDWKTELRTIYDERKAELTAREAA